MFLYSNHFMRDYLGNVRYVSGIYQYNDYDPLGKIIYSSNLDKNVYLYEGKERIPDLAEEYESVYDFGARYYNPLYGRWFAPDPEKQFVNPYIYCGNNPIMIVDPDGNDGIYITFPDYRANGYPYTGHSGVLLIDNKTGLTKYYEYGRYDKDNLGIVKHYAVPNVVMKNGGPTIESLNKVLTAISNTSGHGGALEGAYIKSDNFDVMNGYADEKLKDNDNPNRKRYKLLINNCATFAHDVIKQDQSVDVPFIFDPRPVSSILEYQKKFMTVSYDSKQGVSVEWDGNVESRGKQNDITVSEQDWWQKLINLLSGK